MSDGRNRSSVRVAVAAGGASGGSSKYFEIVGRDRPLSSTKAAMFSIVGSCLHAARRWTGVLPLP